MADYLTNMRVTQIGYIVKNIEEASKRFAQFFSMDVPDIIITDGYEKAQTEYRGNPSKAGAKLAFFHLENLDIELIEPDEEQSVWREHLEEHGEGIQHLAFEIKGMKQKIELFGNDGMKLLQKGEYTGGRYAYVDTTKAIDTVVELLEND
ncbi:MAG: VOC family protein [bacterium]|nr:VOC family protein [bacterium]